MNSRAKVDQIATINPLEVFRGRAEARAYLVAYSMMDFYEAIDGLQELAVSSGLVAEIGQDAVQDIIAREFEAAHV